MTAGSMDSRGLPAIDEEALLATVLKVINGHAVVRPGETLIIRLQDLSLEQAESYQEYLDRQDLPFRALVVIGDELAVARPERGTSVSVHVAADAEALEAAARSLQGHVLTSGITVR